ncbi:Rsc1p [Saccharomyces cerevisiae YJM1419]|nr:Rsc1p [Saccharomyces cerevisiae YJM470]AJR99371.1 Rsc1p [Saccharomyces cerevisiae YJM1418]AJR99872.1 Rsc1p [Saccharomyces cerevisiae YJM1419]CAD6627950.1 HLJ1_G0033940.mRNA.1.CDS.1 [Saccharomyces cerevisiae]CAI4468558.1 BHH_G0020620.mRNA.1.CDS.1 [Saccharomyces cerevisiae]
MVEQDNGFLQKLLKTQYDAVFHLKDENGIEIYPIFNVLPPKKEYPDYYIIIRNPISLNTLKKRLPHYTSPQDFVNDFAQIPWNAMTYNAKDSVIYKYAILLESFIKGKIVHNIRKHYPEVTYPSLGRIPEIFAESMQPSDLSSNPINTQENDEKAGLNPEMKMAFAKLDSSITERKPTNQDYRMQQKNSPAFPTHSASITPQPLASPTPVVNYANITSAHPKTHVRRGRPPVIDLPYVLRIKNILKMMRREVDQNNKTLTLCFEKLPDRNEEPTYYSVITDPICLMDIRKKVKSRKYRNFHSFEEDFQLMLTNFKLYYSQDQSNIIRAQLLEKNFNRLVRIELSKPDEDYLPEGELRYPLDDVEINDEKYQIGDWVLLHNPNDINKPIVGQIFRLWSTTDGNKWLNACWYFRPEQTVHRVDRLFYKNEVMKTGQYRDHPIQDIKGKCYVIHFTRFQRGDPSTKVNGPQFVCEFRYNESDKVFNKIRTWKACLPEELRDQDEPTIPVNGRKFFKYPSPIADLLPANATLNDKVPEPTEGAPTAPPLVGAVYLGPKLERDDLGEYSTSDDCPRYIIRPNDPPEEGKIDYETGTIITDTLTTSSMPRVNSSSTIRLPTLKQTKSIPSSNFRSSSNTPLLHQNFNQTSNFLKLENMNNSSHNLLSHPSVPKFQSPSLLEQSSRSKYHSAKKQTQLSSTAPKKPASKSFTLSSMINSLTAHTSKYNFNHIVIEAPGAFVVPVPMEKNIRTIQSTERFSRSNLKNAQNLGNTAINDINTANEQIIWFKGPGVKITERVIDSGNDLVRVPLNRWFCKNKRRKLDYEEIEEDVMEPPNDFSEDMIANIFNPPPSLNLDMDLNLSPSSNNSSNFMDLSTIASGDNDGKECDTAEESEDENEDTEDEHEIEDIPTTSAFGLNSSAEYLAFRLRELNKL